MYPSARTTQRRPDCSGFLNDVFASIPSLRALFILYSIEFISPWYQDGIKPQRIGRSTCSSASVESGFSTSSIPSSRCLPDSSTGLQITTAILNWCIQLTLSLCAFHCHFTHYTGASIPPGHTMQYARMQPPPPSNPLQRRTPPTSNLVKWGTPTLFPTQMNLLPPWSLLNNKTDKKGQHNQGNI